MKKYIKPSIEMVEVNPCALLVGSDGWEEIPINDETPENGWEEILIDG